jgi:hypothetical protein
MSVFAVNLTNINQGQLDLNPATASPIMVGNLGGNYQGSQMNPSIQRTMFVAGPNRIYRELFDGQTFTDCNYWKRFAYPQVPLDQAFISVVTDDGSIYSDVPSENTFPVTPFNSAGSDTSFVVSADFAFTDADSIIDIIGTYGSYATFCELHNLSGSYAVKYQLNGSSNAIMTLSAGATVVYDTGDLLISKLAWQGAGSSHDVTVEILLGIRSVATS